MNAETFDKLSEKFLADLRGIQKTKGAEYCGSDDRFANFKRGAVDVGVQPETILWIYLRKHIDSLSSFIRSLESQASMGSTALTLIESNLSEPIEGRIKDAINYLLLLNGLIAERRGTEL